VHQTSVSERNRRRTRSVIPAKSVNEAGEEVITYGLVRKIVHIRPFPMLQTVVNGTYVRVDWYVTMDHICDSIPVVELGPETGMWPVHMIIPMNVMRVRIPSVRIRPAKSRFALIDLQKQFV